MTRDIVSISAFCACPASVCVFGYLENMSLCCHVVSSEYISTSEPSKEGSDVLCNFLGSMNDIFDIFAINKQINKKKGLLQKP